MTDLATHASAELRLWHELQSPLVRVLTQPVIERVAGTLTEMQAIFDLQTVKISALELQTQALLQQHAVWISEAQAQRQEILEASAAAISELQAQTEVLRAEHQVAQAEHAMALEVTTDRIDGTCSPCPRPGGDHPR